MDSGFSAIGLWPMTSPRNDTPMVGATCLVGLRQSLAGLPTRRNFWARAFAHPTSAKPSAEYHRELKRTALLKHFHRHAAAVATHFEVDAGAIELQVAQHHLVEK